MVARFRTAVQFRTARPVAINPGPALDDLAVAPGLQPPPAQSGKASGPRSASSRAWPSASSGGSQLYG